MHAFYSLRYLSLGGVSGSGSSTKGCCIIDLDLDLDLSDLLSPKLLIISSNSSTFA